MCKLLKQMTKFGVVGIVCFGIDYGLMIFLTEAIKFNYLISSGVSFSVSVAVNYLLSMKFVFVSRKSRSRTTEFIVFVVLSVTGLLLTEALMWLGVGKLRIHYAFSKVAVTGIVMIYNFVTRKIFLE